MDTVSASDNPQRSFSLKAPYEPSGDQPSAIQTLKTGILSGESEQTLLGVTGSGKTFTMSHVIADLQRPTMVLAPNKTLAAQLYGEFRSLFPDNAVRYFVSYYDYYQPEAYVAASDTYIEKDASINDHIEQMRLAATKALLERRDVIIVATVSAIYGLGDPSSYLEMVLRLRIGDRLGYRALLRWLADMQYTRNDMALQRATYRVRGDVIDVFPAESEKEAVRIELFDDEVENISWFDPLTGEVIRRVKEVNIHPKTHYVARREVILNAVKKIQEELRGTLEKFREEGRLLEEQRLSERTRFDIEMMLEMGYCSGIENYSRFLSNREPGEPPPTLFDYLPADALLVIDESHVTVPQLGAMFRGDRSRKENLVRYGFRLPSALDNRPLRFEEFVARKLQTIYVSATPGSYELEKSTQVVEQLVRPTGLIDPELEVRPVAGQVDDLLSEIRKREALDERVLVTTLTKRMAEDLSEYLSEQDVKVCYLHSDINAVERVDIIRDLRLGNVDVLVGINLLREGLDMPEVSLVAVLDADKEGFLRSTTTLIQTIGRAARHLNGRAIFYADRVTNSMRQALDETSRRRQHQQEFNKQHNITPSGIRKAIVDIMEMPSSAIPKTRYKSILSDKIDDPQKLGRVLQEMEKRMHEHARNLEFELAADLRDEIKVLRDQSLEMAVPEGS